MKANDIINKVKKQEEFDKASADEDTQIKKYINYCFKGGLCPECGSKGTLKLKIEKNPLFPIGFAPCQHFWACSCGFSVPHKINDCGDHEMLENGIHNLSRQRIDDVMQVDRF